MAFNIKRKNHRSHVLDSTVYLWHWGYRSQSTVEIILNDLN